jgi:periplasmic divalent cation tolerance protein
MTALRVFFCNCSQEEAPALARALVTERLAACVNLIPNVQSVYRWEGKLCEDTETTLLIKTSPDRSEELMNRLAELHSYDVPEILGLDTAEVSQAYAEWVHDEIR